MSPAGKEKLASLMIRHSFATGHGDSIDDLIFELDRQLDQWHAAGWRLVESAPHEEVVLLGWWTEDGLGGCDWSTEVGCASHGWRRGGISNMSRHGQATHWQPLPPPPASP